jgi:hypothetical protein
MEALELFGGRGEMGYSAMIDRQINLAFQRVKDLAVDATLVKSTSSSFDFNAGQLSNQTAAPLVLKIVVTGEVTKSNTITRTLMAKGADVVSFSLYDTMQLDGYIWRIGDVLKQSGKVWVFNIFREKEA